MDKIVAKKISLIIFASSVNVSNLDVKMISVRPYFPTNPTSKTHLKIHFFLKKQDFKVLFTYLQNTLLKPRFKNTLSI